VLQLCRHWLCAVLQSARDAPGAAVFMHSLYCWSHDPSHDDEQPEEAQASATNAAKISGTAKRMSSV
jgi:hypothetical protein